MQQFNKGVSVVICCYNSANRLPETLRHLAAQKMSTPLAWELVLVDNASNDATKEVASQLWEAAGAPVPLRILSEPRPGTDHARRTGVYAAQYAYILFCDDDNWLQENYLEIGTQFLDTHAQVGLVGGQTKAIADEPLPDWFYDYSPYYAACAPATASRYFTQEGYWSAGLFGRTHLMRLAFDPAWPFGNAGRIGTNTGCGEDSEMCLRIALMGADLYYFDQLNLQHYMESYRLTVDYRDRLLQSVQQASITKSVYQRALLDAAVSGISKRIACIKWYLIWVQTWLNKKIPARTKRVIEDHLYFCTGNKRWETRMNKTARHFTLLRKENKGINA